MTDKFVTLAHGAGGKQTSELIDRVFKEHLDKIVIILMQCVKEISGIFI